MTTPVFVNKAGVTYHKVWIDARGNPRVDHGRGVNRDPGRLRVIVDEAIAQCRPLSLEIASRKLGFNRSRLSRVLNDWPGWREEWTRAIEAGVATLRRKESASITPEVIEEGTIRHRGDMAALARELGMTRAALYAEWGRRPPLREAHERGLRALGVRRKWQPLVGRSITPDELVRLVLKHGQDRRAIAREAGCEQSTVFAALRAPGYEEARRLYKERTVEQAQRFPTPELRKAIDDGIVALMRALPRHGRSTDDDMECAAKAIRGLVVWPDRSHLPEYRRYAMDDATRDSALELIALARGQHVAMRAATGTSRFWWFVALRQRPELAAEQRRQARAFPKEFMAEYHRRRIAHSWRLRWATDVRKERRATLQAVLARWGSLAAYARLDGQRCDPYPHVSTMNRWLVVDPWIMNPQHVDTRPLVKRDWPLTTPAGIFVHAESGDRWFEWGGVQAWVGDHDDPPALLLHQCLRGERTMESRLERITRAEYSRWNLPGWRMEEPYVRWDGTRIVRGA